MPSGKSPGGVEPPARSLWQCPEGADVTLVLAHGAGAGMGHRNMQALADAFGRRRIATLRFNFPFIEAGRKRVDTQAVATSAIEAACAAAAELGVGRLWLGGHSFGGRMATHAVLDRGVEPAGLVLCSFPLHPPGRPASGRAVHLTSIELPMLFLSGNRDKLAEPELMEALVGRVPHAQLHWLNTADHGYRVLKSRGVDEDVFDEMARVARAFMDAHSSP